MENIGNCVLDIQTKIKQYIIDNNIKSLIIGISGGIDSTVNAAMLRPVCDELNIPLIGRYIHIESNKQIEKESATLVGNAFCNDFDLVDLTLPFNHLLSFVTKENDNVESIPFKIRKGNIKARMRMSFLRDITQANNGLMIDNSNFTEFNLGFFTVNDNGDISPMKNLFKTEVYEIANFLSNSYQINGETIKKQAIDFSISLTPTDGLGITNSDIEQIGAKSYEQIDDIFKSILIFNSNTVKLYLERKISSVEIELTLEELYKLHTKEVVLNVLNRWIKSEYKRKHLPISF